MERESNQAARLRCSGFGAQSTVFWRYIEGFFVAIAHLSSAKDPMLTRLQGGGANDNHLEVRLSWR